MGYEFEIYYEPSVVSRVEGILVVELTIPVSNRIIKEIHHFTLCL